MIKKKDTSIILDELIEFNKNGYPKGYSVNHQDFPIDFALGTCTDITGYPFFGKSLILKEIIVSLAINHDWKFAVYMPDDGSDREVMANLIHKMTGKTVVPNYPNSMTPKEISKWYLQAANSFIFVDKPFVEPKAFWDFAKANKCQGAVVDSWNYMAHEGSAVSTEYLRDILAYRNTFMQNNNMHSFIVIHPKNPDPKAVKEGRVNKPTVYDLMGGSEWNNNGRNLVIVHKQDKSNYSEPYLVSVEKVKPKHYGTLGQCYLNLKWDNQRFYTMNHETQMREYAYGLEEKVIDPLNSFTPTTQFNSSNNEPF